MKLGLRVAAALAGVLSLFAACANDDSSDPAPAEEAGVAEAGLPESAAPDAADGGREADAAALRCSGNTCLVDLPNPAIYGLSEWIFAGVHVDPTIGAWAIANGVEGTDDGATAQLLHLEDDVWKVRLGITFGTTARPVKLTGISGDGHGKLIAVGTTIDDGAGVVLRGDGTTFGVERLAEDLRGTWVSGPGDAYVVGGDGGVFHEKPDGGWAYEGKSPATWSAVWGSGIADVYVGGSTSGEFQDNGYLGHRTSAADGGAPKWSYLAFPSPTQEVGTPGIISGVAPAPANAWWSGDDFFGSKSVVAHSSLDAGKEVWTRDAFTPSVDLRAFSARSMTDIWAVGGLGRLYHFDGTSWKDAFLVFNGAPLVANLTGISAAASGELFIVGEGVALRRTP